MKNRNKLKIHIITILLFIFGICVIHITLNQGGFTFGDDFFMIPSKIKFLGLSMSIWFWLDLGIISIVIGFVLEIYLSFSPIKITED
jgi:hypothetical protein